MGQRFGVVRSSRRAHNPETGSSNLPGAISHGTVLRLLLTTVSPRRLRLGHSFLRKIWQAKSITIVLTLM